MSYEEQSCRDKDLSLSLRELGVMSYELKKVLNFLIFNFAPPDSKRIDS